jgi:hypothetical protein
MMRYSAVRTHGDAAHGLLRAMRGRVRTSLINDWLCGR